MKNGSTSKVALITGASSGIGRELALVYARRGAHVIVSARRRDRLQALVREIDAAGGRGEALPLDLSDGDAAFAALSEAALRAPIDLVIANAGVGAVTPAKKLSWPRVKEILSTNLVGAAATISAVVPSMLARGAGRVVGIASIAGFRGLPRFSAYSASKAGLITFLESLRIDLAGTGVSVTTVCPGYVQTDMLSPGKPHPFVVPVEEAARLIAKAADARKDQLTFPRPVAVGARALRLVPQPLYQLLATRTRMKY